MKTDVNRLLLILTKKINFSTYFATIELFLNSKPKVVYLRPFLLSLPSSKF